VAGNQVRGTSVSGRGDKSNINWKIAPDGSVDEDGMKGKFAGNDFNGTWTRKSSQNECNFAVRLKKE